MTDFDKARFVMNRIVQAIINTYIPLMLYLILAGAVFKVKSEILFSAASLIIAGVLSLLISGVVIYFNTRKYIRKTENDFLENNKTAFFR